MEEEGFGDKKIVVWDHNRDLINNRANTILAQGAALADLTMCDRFEDGDITSLLKTGDEVIVDPIRGVVKIK